MTCYPSLGVNHSIFQSTVFFDLCLPVSVSVLTSCASVTLWSTTFEKSKTSMIVLLMRWKIGGRRSYRGEKKERIKRVKTECWEHGDLKTGERS